MDVHYPNPLTQHTASPKQIVFTISGNPYRNSYQAKTQQPFKSDTSAETSAFKWHSFMTIDHIQLWKQTFILPNGCEKYFSCKLLVTWIHIPINVNVLAWLSQTHFQEMTTFSYSNFEVKANMFSWFQIAFYLFFSVWTYNFT